VSLFVGVPRGAGAVRSPDAEQGPVRSTPLMGSEEGPAYRCRTITPTTKFSPAFSV
jgi:hypothetical protein